MVHGKYDVMGLGDVELGGIVGGVEAAGQHAEVWDGFAKQMGEYHQRLERILADSKGSWEGAAANSMQSGVSPLGQWAKNAHQAGLVTKSSADGYTDAFARAKTSMPEPVKVNTTANPTFTGIPTNFTTLLDAQKDQHGKEVHAQQAKAEAVRVMQGYEGGATSSRDGMGSFPPPPDITTSVHDTDTPVTPVAPNPHKQPPPTGTGDSQTQTNSYVGPAGSPVSQPPNSTPGGPGVVTPSSVPGTSPSSFVPPSSPRSPGATPPDGQRFAPAPSNSVVPAPEGGVPGGRPGRVGGFGPRGGGVPGESGGQAGGSRGGTEGPTRGRGPGVGAGPLDAERMTTRGGAAAGARSAGGPGMMGAGHGSGRREEDDEHRSPSYLQDTHDDFWDDAPPVAPDVIE